MTTLFDNALVKKIFTGSLAPFANTIIILVITLIMKFLLDWYMSTKSGYLLRAVGDNETIVTSMGVDKGVIKIIGLAIANGLVTLSGCIFAQQQRYFDISMGNRNDGHRSGKRDHRYQPVEKSFFHSCDNKRNYWFDHL